MIVVTEVTVVTVVTVMTVVTEVTETALFTKKTFFSTLIFYNIFFIFMNKKNQQQIHNSNRVEIQKLKL